MFIRITYFKLLQLTVFAIPFLIYINIGSIPIFTGYLLIYLLGFLWFFNTLRTRVIVPPLALPISVFLLSVIASLLVTTNLMGYIAKVWHLLSSLLLYFLVVNIVKTSDQSKKIIKLILISGVIISLIGVVQYTVINVLGYRWLVDKMMLDWGNILYGQRTAAVFKAFREQGHYHAWYKPFFGDIRATSLFGNPTENGMFTGVVFLIGIAYFWRRPLTFWAIIGAVLLLLNLILSQSRGTYVGVMAGYVLIVVINNIKNGRSILLQRKRKPMTMLVKSAMVVVILGLFTSIIMGQERFKAVFGSIFTLRDGGSAADRFWIWQEYLEIFVNNPIIGVGFGSYGGDVNAHNMYINLAVETGIFGLIGFVGWMLASGFQAHYLSKHSNHDIFRALGAGYLAALAAFALNGLTGGQYLSAKFMPQMWTLAGLVSVGWRLRRRRRRFVVDNIDTKNSHQFPAIPVGPKD